MSVARYLLPALFAFGLATAHAQSSTPAGAPDEAQERLAARFESMATALALTDSQRTKLEPILADYGRRRADLMKSFGGGAADLSRREKIDIARQLRALRDEQDKAVAKVLTASQMTTYQTLQEKQREAMRAQFQGKGKTGGKSN